MTEPEEGGTPKWWHILLGIEAVALLIALVTPITPDKTGSDWSAAELFFDAPGYLVRVAVDFVGISILLALLAGAFMIYFHVQKRRNRS